MRRRLPSLLAVRYFEAAGRLLSFTAAANELNVTQAAVSHQVRLIEDEVGCRLFNRLHQRVELTPEGKQFLETVSECFDRISETFAEVSGQKNVEQIYLSVTPYMASRFILPQLEDFLTVEKNCEIIFHLTMDARGENDGKVDMKIFFTTKPEKNSQIEFLFMDELVPVCSPKLLAASKTNDPVELLTSARIGHEFSYRWWVDWAKRTGIDPNLVERGNIFDDPSALEQSAIYGRTMILGSKRFLHDRIEAGEIALPFGEENALKIYYYLQIPPSKERRSTRIFRNWIIEQSTRFSTLS